MAAKVRNFKAAKVVVPAIAVSPPLAPAWEARKPKVEEWEAFPVADDVDTTDVGSTTTDCESSAEGNSSACDTAVTAPERTSRLRRLAPRKLHRVEGRGFIGTPLSPIPGTPVCVPAKAEKAKMPPPPALPPQLPWKAGVVVPPPPKAPVLALTDEPCALPPGLVSSPIRRARHDFVMNKAKEEMLPVKVRPPAGPFTQARPLDPRLPAKKVLPFPEFAASAAAISKALDPNVPAMKRLSAFLLAEPPSVLSMLAVPR